MIEYLSQFNIGQALLGGLIIGLSATLLLKYAGRIAGICGITYALIDSKSHKNTWRWLFLIGLVIGAFLTHLLTDIEIPEAPTNNLVLLIIGGLLTGFGSKVGSGCTSGHGIAGIARLSKRSIVATITFMFAGFIFVYLLRHMMGMI